MPDTAYISHVIKRLGCKGNKNFGYYPVSPRVFNKIYPNGGRSLSVPHATCGEMCYGVCGSFGPAAYVLSRMVLGAKKRQPAACRCDVGMPQAAGHRVWV
jgi:hypothetical protein